jgi:ribosomal protein S18 acetylase RimI-like enzyme
VAVSPLSKVVGVVTVRVREEGGFWSYFSSNKKMIGYVMTVCVLSTFRRKGIASKLLNMLTSYCRKRFEYLKLELHCLQDNIAAITLYKKHGFQNQLALSEFYFFDGTHHDAYYLSQDLIPQRHTTRKEKDQTLVEYIQNRLFSCMR